MNAVLKVVNIFRTVVALLPTLALAVQAVEGALPPGTGVNKLEMVRVALERAYATEQAIEAPFSTVWPILSTLVSGIVATFNATGIFKKLTPATDPVPVAPVVVPVAPLTPDLPSWSTFGKPQATD